MGMFATSVPNFYQSRHYIASINRSVSRTPRPESSLIRGGADAVRAALLSYFDEVTFDRAGCLLGEYVLLPNAMILIRRDGCLLKSNVAWEEPRAATAIDDYCATPEFSVSKAKLLENWESMPRIDNPIVLSDPFLDNYYHFSLECVPRLRHFASYAASPCLVPGDGVLRRFQTDLLGRLLGGRMWLPVTGALRVRNPLLSHDTMSQEGVEWLRASAGIRAFPGHRNIYVRRSGRGTRTAAGGGISESAAFLALLGEFGFEIVEFGDGGRTVEAQVALLNGARLVLAAHGAALTNLAYLNPPLSVVEIVGLRTPRAVFMHVSSMLGLRHEALLSPDYDAQGNIIVDAEALRAAITAALV